MSKTRVAYYAHHVGSGHLRHAYNVARHPDFEVMVMSGAAPHVHFDNFVPLGSDFVEGYQQPLGAPFHYIPVGHDNVKQRGFQIVDALTKFNPDVVITDVSAETAALAKLCGYPTIVRLMHGDRTDRAHTDMFDLADGIIAYFGEAIDPSVNPEWKAKTTFAGMLTLFPKAQAAVDGGVTVLTSLGGKGVDLASISEAAATTPEVTWTVVGHTQGSVDGKNVNVVGLVDDPDPYLVGADLVVTSTGHNAVRAAINARRPMVLVPEKRMYDEQLRFAEALHGAFGIPLARSWGDLDWSSVLHQAKTQKPDRIAEQMLVDDKHFFDALSTAVASAIRQR